MKKRLFTLIVCVFLLSSALSCIPAYANIQDTTLEPIWIEKFEDSTKYGDTEKYTASVAEGVLTLQAKNDAHRDKYTLSSENDALSGKTKLTFAINFKIDSLHTSGSIFASYGHSDSKAYIAGIQRLSGYAYLVHGKAVEGESSGKLTTTQRFIVSDTTDEAKKVAFPASDICTMIIEVDENSSSVCTIYVNGVKSGVAGNFRGDNYKKYDATSDTEKTMDGHFGLLVPTDDTVVKIGTYAVYDGTGLDHDIIKQQVHDAADFGATEDNEASEDADRGELLYSQKFDDPSKYGDTDKYTASVADGVLTLQAKNDSHRDTYTFSGENDILSNRTKLTFAVNFTLDALHASGGIFASYGHSENKAYIAGLQSINGVAYLVHGKAVEGEASGKLTTTQRHIVTPFADGTPSSNGLEFPDSEELDGVYTMVIEVDNNTSTVCSIYKNGILIGVAGELRAGDKYQKYDAIADTAKTMNGHFGMLVPTEATIVNVGAYAIYSGVGLDHSDIMEQVYDTEDFGGAVPNIPITPPTGGDTVTDPPSSDSTNIDSTDTADTQDTAEPPTDGDESTNNNRFWNTITITIFTVFGVVIVCGAVAAVIIAVTIKKKKGRR